ncbi:MAG: glucokinase [Alphaproteobacteria bacterium]|nr:glucokinase [Alphaproteobacteria bacterium]
MKILCDIGGTYVRFARFEDGHIKDVQKQPCDDFEGLEDALDYYQGTIAMAEKAPVYIASAGEPDEKGVWHVTNNAAWRICAGNLQERGWTLARILNDFEAAAWGVLDLGPSDLATIQKGCKTQNPYCLIGPGTGLGLAYLYPNETPFVQKTHGGLMLAAAVTPEQHRAVEKVSVYLKRPATFQDFVSGRGLVNTYNALGPHRVDDAAEILERKDTEQGKTVLRLFHEFFGIFAHTAVITVHSHGGLYIMGGVLENLIEQNMFDKDVFLNNFNPAGGEAVARMIEETPVHLVKEPYLAFRGLKILIEKQHA